MSESQHLPPATLTAHRVRQKIGHHRVANAAPLQIVSQAIFPGLLPSLVGISLYRLHENVRSSLVLGFVGAGGIGFLILTAINLFQYRQVSTLLILMFVLVTVVERLAAYIRTRIR